MRSSRSTRWGRAAAVVSAVVLTVSTSALAARAATSGPDAGDPAPVAADAPQILPGQLVGAGYDPDRFYVRQGDGPREPTFTAGWQGDAGAEQVRGTLPNLRSANGVFDDESGKIRDYDDDFDARANTDALIANLDAYREHGILAVDVNLQGGNPGYGGAENPAFTDDGTLRQEWKDRAGSLIEAAAQRNMYVVLGYFYFHQIGALDGDDAIRNAVTDATDWLVQSNYRNVVIEIANEYNDDDYPDIISSDDGMAGLIRLAQSRFDGAGFRLAVSASRWGDGSWPDDAVADAADLALIHCNGLDASGCADKAADHRGSYDYPIVVNETDNTHGDYSDDTLGEDTESVDDIVATGASWGYMLNQWNQYAACYFDDDCGKAGFDWALGDDPGVHGSGAELLDNFAHAVLDHLQAVVYPSSP